MKILSVEAFKDGGTLHIVTDEGVYYVDRRLESRTKGELYDDYPGKFNINAKLIPDPEYKVRQEIHNALQTFTHESFRDWDMTKIMEFALPKPLHRHEQQIKDIKQSHPKAGLILDAIKRVDNMNSMEWDTMWESDLYKLTRIKEILDSK